MFQTLQANLPKYVLSRAIKKGEVQLVAVHAGIGYGQLGDFCAKSILLVVSWYLSCQNSHQHLGVFMSTDRNGAQRRSASD